MKKTCKTMLSLLLALVMALSLSVSTFAADPTVDIVYKGKDKLLITPKTTEFTTTDLFGGGFKGVMPGDTLKETIIFKNDTTTSRSRYVKLYIQALAHDAANQPEDKAIADVEKMNEFLSQLTMKVTNAVDGKVIFEGSPDKKGDLANSVLLGTFNRGAEKTILKVELSVPQEMDNTYANMHGEVDWQFIAREYTSGGGNPTVTPGTLIQTGQLNWPIAVLAAAGGVLIALGWVILRKKRHGNA